MCLGSSNTSLIFDAFIHLFFKDFIYLFMRDPEREEVTDSARGRGVCRWVWEPAEGMAKGDV